MVYGENFERAEINGERLLNITRQRLNRLGIIQIDHQDKILKAVTNIYKKVSREMSFYIDFLVNKKKFS